MVSFVSCADWHQQDDQPPRHHAQEGDKTAIAIRRVRCELEGQYGFLHTEPLAFAARTILQGRQGEVLSEHHRLAPVMSLQDCQTKKKELYKKVKYLQAETFQLPRPATDTAIMSQDKSYIDTAKETIAAAGVASRKCTFRQLLPTCLASVPA